MSELTRNLSNQAGFRRQLLTTASVIALASFVSAGSASLADEADHPTVWIDLGGQAEMLRGTTTPVVAQFMTLSPLPPVYHGVAFVGDQKAARFSLGAEGNVTIQPQDSDWKFSIGIRYGRSRSKRHAHNQIHHPDVPWSFSYYGNRYQYNKYFRTSAVADSRSEYSEQHFVLDFTVGRDVGIGLFGRQGTSTLNAGVRIASFVAHSSAFMTARPEIGIVYQPRYGGIALVPVPTFHQYTMSASADRSFRGVGPSLSWNASADLMGTPDAGEISLDWGVNGAILFGKQKAKTEHTTQAYHNTSQYAYPRTLYLPHHDTRSRSVVVPNLGGFAGLTFRKAAAKVSFGYRADFFFGAVDAGIDSRRTKDLGFHGPFAALSIGLGG